MIQGLLTELEDTLYAVSSVFAQQIQFMVKLIYQVFIFMLLPSSGFCMRFWRRLLWSGPSTAELL